MEVRHFKPSLLLVLWCFLSLSSSGTEGASHQTTLTHCCDLGKNYANSDVACGNIKTPIEGVAVDKKDEHNCMISLQTCCKTQTKENDCRLGINDAETGNCNAATGTERKECCEACNLGKMTSSSGTCENSFSLGAAYDKHFKSCCEKLLPKTTTVAKRDAGEKNDQVALGNLCEIEDLCAQICIPTGDSYRCDCNPGYTLMADGNSCKEVNFKQATSKKGNRCDVNNPCAHNCVDTGVAIYCTCNDGYELDVDKRSCVDINECERGQHECLANETCSNGDGYYDCISDDADDYDIECPKGYKYSWENQKCEDIDECSWPLTCLPSETCKNTDGAFECVAGEPECPPGYHYKSSIQECADFDECITGQDDCNRESQVCLNNKGGYTCVDKASKKTCPPGYMMHPILQSCVDIDECAQEMALCAADELCVNEPGGHTCTPKGEKPKAILPNQNHNQPATTTTTSTTMRTTTRVTTKPTTTTTTTTAKTTKATMKSTTSKPTTTTTKATTTQRTIKSTQRTFPTPQIQRYPPPTPSKPILATGSVPHPPATTCNRGYRYSEQSHQCEDIDECEGTHNCDNYQQCHNTLGSYICNCKLGFRKDQMTGACVDINECQIGTFDCDEGHRCDNTLGSFLCSRVSGCGTGYTLNYESGNCEDDDECALGIHSCEKLGRNLVCRNTQGSYRCERVYPIQRPVYRPIQNPNYTIVSAQSKKCLPGYYMDAAGACQDIDECQSNPCARSHKCINLNGRYDCVSRLICTGGYELNSLGDSCVDVNECSRGTHSCDSTEICKNYNGYHRCECPPGHIKQHGKCVDIDECKYYKGRACPWHSSECVNTIGSYTCECKEGYEKLGEKCVDVDECRDNGRCEYRCQNTMGGYKCYCKSGFTLNADNRTCTDIDECKLFSNGIKCIGTCLNTPGSYACGCPPGYRLGTDGRSCNDIDECDPSLGNRCPDPDSICFNTRGGYECPSIACPANYIRDRNHKSRCKFDSQGCRFNRNCAHHEADQITFHFFSIVSNTPMFDGPIQFFKMTGPVSVHSRVAFKFAVKNIKCPSDISPAGRDHFRLEQDQNVAIISMKSIEGPQTIEITMHLLVYNQNVLTNTVVAKLILFISQYTI